MSNTLAIAAVTAVLEGRITALLNANGLAGFDVVVDQPKGEGPDPGIYIKPYRVVPSAALRNADLPTRRSDGSVSTRPRLALDVDILLTFVGEPGTYDPERLAGLVMTDLHANPSLGRQEIKDYISGLSAGHVLSQADLGDQLDRVRFTPLVLGVEELSRVWGLFGLSLYGLSIAYQAGVLLLDAEVRPSVPLPVLNTEFLVSPGVGPIVNEVSSSSFRQPLARIGDTLNVKGTGLRGASTWLRFGALLLELAPATVGDDRLSLVLTSALGVKAGVQALQVVHRAQLGPPADPLRTVAQSNTVALGILPKITGTPSVSGAGPVAIRVRVEPLPAAEQEVALLLDGLPAGGQVETRDFEVDGVELVFRVPALAAGDYLARIRIDDTLSLLELGAGGSFDAPKVSVP